MANVYAYGASAGGTLAALLSGDGLVAAAVAKAPVSDLVNWDWPLTPVRRRATTNRSALSRGGRDRLSPIAAPGKSPLLIYQGRADNVVPAAMNEAFAANFENG